MLGDEMVMNLKRELWRKCPPLYKWIGSDVFSDKTHLGQGCLGSSYLSGVIDEDRYVNHTKSFLIEDGELCVFARLVANGTISGNNVEDICMGLLENRLREYNYDKSITGSIAEVGRLLEALWFSSPIAGFYGNFYFMNGVYTYQICDNKIVYLPRQNSGYVTNTRVSDVKFSPLGRLMLILSGGTDWGSIRLVDTYTGLSFAETGGDVKMYTGSLNSIRKQMVLH